MLLENHKFMKINVKVITKAKENKVVFNKETENWKIYVTEAPEKGRANKRVIDLLAENFNVSKANVNIVCGHASSGKIIEINKE